MDKGSVITLEIIAIIWAPLGILYARGRWSKWWMAVNLPILYGIWFLTNSPAHELSHAAAVYAVGGRVTETRLLTRFWRGEYGVAWIHADGVSAPWQHLIIGASPYIVDAIAIVCESPRSPAKSFSVVISNRHGLRPAGLATALQRGQQYYGLDAREFRRSGRN